MTTQAPYIKGKLTTPKTWSLVYGPIENVIARGFRAGVLPKPDPRLLLPIRRGDLQ